MYKFIYYVPETHLEITKQAIFNVGAGKYPSYDQCCWQVKGTGQFRPLDSANPHIGTHQQLETLEEYRVELLCEDNLIQSAINALLDAHPYEAVAYEAFKLDLFP